MELNVDIWGTPEQQTGQISNISSDYGVFKSSLATCDTIKHYAENIGKTDLIDESVNYWQISDDSMFNHYVFIRRDGNNRHIYETVKNINPKSIFLVMRPPVGNNLYFDFSNASCPIWNSSVTSNLPYNNYGDIITTFDYNGICARYLLNCFKKDGDGNPTGAVTSFSVYDYFNSDENDIPIKDQYIIVAISSDIFAVKSNGANAYNVNHVFYPVSSTPVETPQPNYYYTDSDYTAYNRTTCLCGHNVLSSANGYGTQQGAFGQNGNAAWYTFDSRYWEIRNYLNSSNQYIEYFAFTGTYEDMLKQLATLGFWFKEDLHSGSTINQVIVLGQNCNDDKCIMPEIVGGQTTGNYKRGSTAAADPQATWGTNWRENTGYTGDKPYRGGDGDTGDLSSVFHRPVLNGSCIYYNMSPIQLKLLINAINSGYQPADNDQFILDFKGVDPSEYISSILYYPDGFTCGNVENQVAIAVKIGALELTLTAYEADITNQNIVSFGTYKIDPYYNDFRDYAPYTSLDLYIPFCGNVELDPSVFIGHTLQVYLFIDFPTGNCTGVVMRDSMVYDTISGSCGVSIPLTAQNVGSYQNAIKSAEIALKQAEIQRKTAWLSVAGSGLAVVGGAVSGNPLAVVGGVAGMLGAVNGLERAELAVESAQYNLTHTAPANRSISAASPANAICMDYDCHLLIKRPIMTNGFDDAIYSHTVGNACAINAPLSDFSGLVVCADADLSGISAPAEIKTAILSALKSGVYI